MRHRAIILAALLAAALGAIAAPAGAVAPGQVDTFSDLTTQGWLSGPGGNPVPPSVIATGGPGGAGDAYLLVRAIGGVGPGSRLAAINAAQWAGNYVAAGIGQITMHVANFGTTELSIRLFIADVPNNQALTSAVVLPPGSGWTPAVFSIAPGDLTMIIGNAASALSNATEMRIIHSVGTQQPPPVIVGQLGVDNVEAVGPPVPTNSMTWGRIKSLYRGAQ